MGVSYDRGKEKIGVGWEENNEILDLDSNLPGWKLCSSPKKNISSSLWLVLPKKGHSQKKPDLVMLFRYKYRDGKDFF